MGKRRIHSWLAFWSLLTLMVATGCGDKARDGGANQSRAGTADPPPAGTADQSETCNTSFELYHEAKPFANEQIAIYPVVDGKILTSAERKLGSGQTDASGHGAIEFKCSESPAEYVFLWEPEGKCCSMLRHEGKALSFSCGGSRKTCDLGRVVFEVFEFGFGG